MWKFVILGVGIALIIWRNEMLNAKLQAALDENNAATARIVGKLGSIKTFIQGVPALVAAAVADALAAHDVSEEEAAATIAASEKTAEDAVDDTLAAIDNNPSEEPEDTTAPVSEAPVEEGPAPE